MSKKQAAKKLTQVPFTQVPQVPQEDTTRVRAYADAKHTLTTEAIVLRISEADTIIARLQLESAFHKRSIDELREEERAVQSRLIGLIQARTERG